MPSLTVYLDGDAPAVFELDTPVVSLGRNTDSDIQIDESHVSSNHARFKLEPNGDYRISDLGSSNGTSVNGKPAHNTVLKDGDKILFGVHVRALYQSEIAAKSKLTSSPPTSTAATSSIAARKNTPPASATPRVVPETVYPEESHLEAIKRERNLLESKLIGMRREQHDLSGKLRDGRSRLAQLSQEIATTEQLNLQAESDFQNFQDQIEQAERELRNAEELQRVQKNTIEENRIRVQDLLNEKKEAERQWEEYQEKAAAKLVEIQTKTKAAVNQGNEKIADLEEMFDQRKQELANIVRIIDAKKAEEKKAFTLKAEADAALKADLAAARKEIDSLTTAHAKAEKRLLDVASGHSAPAPSPSAPSASAEEASNLHSDINARRASLDYLNEQWKKTKSELENRRGVLQSDLNDITEKIERKRRELAALGAASTQSLSPAEQTDTRPESEPVKQRARIDLETNAANEAVKRELEKIEGNIARKQKDLDTITASLESKTAELREADTKLAQTDSQIHKATDHLRRSQNAAGRYVPPPAPLAPASGHRLLPRATANPFASATPPVNGSIHEEQRLALTVLAPEFDVPSQSFPEGAGAPDLYLHPPVGLHALAACTNGFLIQSLADEASRLHPQSPVLLALPGNFEACKRESARVLSLNHGRPRIAVLLPETLKHIGPALEKDSRFQAFTNLLSQFQGVVSTDAKTARLVESLTVVTRHLHLPFPSPIDSNEWEFSTTIEKRSPGLFLSADGFDPGSDQHNALLGLISHLATDHHIPLTVYHHKPGSIPELDVPDDLLEFPEPKLNYVQYLSLVATHRFVAGFGSNLAGGDIRGDALLCRNLFVGIQDDDAEKIFAGTIAPSDELENIAIHVNNLANDSQLYLDHVEKSQWLALEKLSFQAARGRLEDFVQSFTMPALTA